MIEVMLGASIMVIAMTAFLGVFFGQSYLAATARNLTAAMNDATRVMEQIRSQNTGATGTCPAFPNAIPTGFNSWNDWLNTAAPAGGGPKSINQPNRDTMELVVVTCQDGSSGAAIPPYCGITQVGSTEWTPWYQGAPPGGKVAGNTSYHPIRVTVAVGWYQMRRAMGGTAGGAEFTAITTTSGGTSATNFYVGPDANNNGVIESQAMLTSLVTCR